MTLNHQVNKDLFQKCYELDNLPKIFSQGKSQEKKIKETIMGCRKHNSLEGGIKRKMSWGGGRVGPGYKSQEKWLQATLYNRTSQRPST